MYEASASVPLTDVPNVSTRMGDGLHISSRSEALRLRQHQLSSSVLPELTSAAFPHHRIHRQDRQHTRWHLAHPPRWTRHD